MNNYAAALRECFEQKSEYVVDTHQYTNGSRMQIVHPAFVGKNDFVISQAWRYLDYRSNTGKPHEEAIAATQSHFDGEPALFISPYASQYKVIEERYGLGGWKQVLDVLVEDTETGNHIQFRRNGYANGGTCRLGCWNAETVQKGAQ